MINHSPNLSDGYFVRIQIFMRLQRWDEALYDIKIIKLLKKESSKIKMMESKCHEKKKNYSECIKILKYLVEESECKDFQTLKKCKFLD